MDPGNTRKEKWRRKKIQWELKMGSKAQKREMTLLDQKLQEKQERLEETVPPRRRKNWEE